MIRDRPITQAVTYASNPSSAFPFIDRQSLDPCPNFGVHFTGATFVEGIRTCIEIPLTHWTRDQPVTAGLHVAPACTAIITLTHPRRFKDGDLIIFPQAGLSAQGALADLLVEVRVAAADLQGTSANCVGPKLVMTGWTPAKHQALVNLAA